MNKVEELTKRQPATIMEAIETCAEIVTELSLRERDDLALEFAADVLTHFLYLGLAQPVAWEFVQGRDCGDESDAQR